MSASWVWLGDGQSGGSYTSGPYKIVLHTTETSGMPGYNNGGSAPHVTYDPEDRTFYQHTEFGTAARSLRNLPGNVQTNRDSALQLEIICYSNKAGADQKPYRLWVGDLSDEHYEDIAGFCAQLVEQYGVKAECRQPRGTPKYGYDSPARMSFDEWDSFGGICGHFEVPEQTHWDPGALDIERIVNSIVDNTGPNGEPHWDVVSEWAKNSWSKAWAAGLITEASIPNAPVFVEQYVVFMDRLGLIPDAGDDDGFAG